MKVLVLYRPESEFARLTESFIHDFEHQHGSISGQVNVMDVDSREGSATASLYDIMQHPAILVLTDDGRLVKDWQGGDRLPLMSDVAGYLYSS